jgi:altronate hydrolase
MVMSDTVVLNPNDEVAIALRPVTAGETVSYTRGGKEASVTVQSDIPRGHKILIRPVQAGEHVHKFGYSIGVAKEAIVPGSWVHTHNLKTGLSGILNYEYNPVSPALIQPLGKHTFQGYIRENGDAGIRNDIWIINTVGCINKTCEMLAKLATKQFESRGIDGVYHFPHPFGCSNWAMI